MRYLLGVAWPYANNEAHLGHYAGSLLPPDIFARFQRMRGHDVLMVGGSDSHGTPITVSAEKEHVSPKDIVMKYHEKFLQGFQKLGISFDLYTMTMTENHAEVVHDMFKKHLEKGYLYKETQKQLFDTKVSKFLPDRYVEGACPHCGFVDARGDQCDNCGKTYDAIDLKNPRSKLSDCAKLEIRESEHFVFDLGKVNDFLCEWLGEQNKSHWRSHVLKFSKSMVDKRDLHGRTITRDLDWGVSIPVAGFESKRLYVWYEAVMGYLSATVEWSKVSPYNSKSLSWKDFWYESDQLRSYYFMGKDNITFHTVLWPAFLKAYGQLQLPYEVAANEYLNYRGEKFSKSRGNSIKVLDVAEQFQADAIRYVLTSLAPENSDTDFTWEDFYERVNSELVANWGNLVNRVLGFASKRFDNRIPQPDALLEVDTNLFEDLKRGFKKVEDLYDHVKLRAATEEIRSLCQKVNQYLSEQIPWTTIKTDEPRARTVIFVALQSIAWLNTMWAPVLIESCQMIHEMLGFSGKLFGESKVINVEEKTFAHHSLTYDSALQTGKWALASLVPGTQFGVIQAPFQKLDPKDLSAEPS